MKWPDDRQYMSKTEWEPIGFFAECLCNSKHFDLMLGFFSSSAIELLSCGFAAFIYNGGKMRLIVNDILSQQDKMAVELGCHSLVGNVFDTTDLPRLKQTLSKRDTHFFECLSYLIRVGRIEVKIISPKGRSGISHTKMGMFGDALNKVAFAGSCNFSYSAFIENIEQLSVFCDWDGVLEKKRINAINSRFENAFNGLDNSLNIIEPSDVRTCLAQEFGGKDIAQLLEDESKLIGEKLAETDNLSDTVSSVLKKMQIRVDSYIEQISDHDLDIKLSEGHPHFPYTTGPRPYQVKAFENWKANGQKGLFGMATGTGKTITALNCLLEIYNRFGYYKAIIIVPTISLVSQWEHECFNFGFSNVIKVFSKNDSWKESVASLRFREKFYGSDNSLSYVIITTYASFAKEATATLLSEFPKNKLLLIADEAHNMGAASLKKLMPRIQYLRKIGLSATPERQFDEVGNKSICQFFGVEAQ